MGGSSKLTDLPTAEASHGAVPGIDLDTGGRVCATCLQGFHTANVVESS